MYVCIYICQLLYCANTPGTEVGKAHQLLLPGRCMKAYADLCRYALYL